MINKERIKIKKSRFSTFTFCFIVIACIIFGYDAFYNLEMRAEDALYQSEQSIGDDIYIIGIDPQSLEDMGPFNTWTRADMADAIAILNQDPDNAPAAIGIDIMYFGETDEEYDSYLAEVASQNDNIVTASLVNFDSKLEVNEDGEFYLNTKSISKFEEPYEKLKNSTTQGHINTVADKDGVIRNSIYKIDIDDNSEIYSFAYEIYKKFMTYNGRKNYAIPLVDENNSWYVSYSAKPGGFYDGFSFSSLIAGDIPSEIFSGKIVLIGPYAAGLLDEYNTPIDYSSKMFGVEIHANMINALLKEDFKMYVSNTMQLIIFALILVICLNLFYRLKIKHSLPILLGVILGYLGIAILLYNLGYIIKLIYLPIFVVLGYIVILGASYVLIVIEKKKIEGTFKRYIAPQVVDKIMEEGLDNINLGGKTTDIACLFVDIRGFTPLSEKLTPAQVVEVLNEYFDLITRCIFENGGTLDKFIGDAAMAIFNAPLEVEDYTYKAVKTACDIVKGAKELEDKLFERFGKEVRFGIGVNKGEAVVGNIGSSSRMDYTAIGNTVNTAARLESNAKPGQILISADVYNEVKDRIQAESIGEIALKGKSEKIEVFSIKL